MNVFVLNAGRCGSTTFIEACKHITNYSASHESRSRYCGARRLAYPANHIEADNRLSWMLGRLDRRFGDQAFYVHLRRDRDATVQSFVRRADFGIMRAYRGGILLGGSGQSAEDIARDYLDTVESNIALFLRGKSGKMDFFLEQAPRDFPLFWERIHAEGNLDLALAEWSIRHNASPP